ncbi:MAG: N-methyl-D-aspartate receptor NMDAR2C subunit [bacterium]|nr:N-methyl-D-aspartate receptor NMDAR2C subunit [bacterium]
MDLHTRWQQTWQRVGIEAPTGLFEELVAAYDEPHRAYHTTDHLAECFGQLDGSPATLADRGALELAIWFHDAIYDTKASDNEARSADWASTAIGGIGAARTEAVARHILVTAHTGVPSDDDQRLLLDIDLSILGAAKDRFGAYEEQIRREYEWVPEDAYRKARTRILSHFAARPRLYHTEYFFERLEERARRNLRRSLDALAG